MMRSRLSTTALLASAAAFLFSGCMLDYEEGIAYHNQYIVNGQPNEGDPAVAMFFLGVGTCTGTMITPKIMATARHCVIDQNGTGIPVANMAVYVGSQPAQGDPSVPVVEYVYHPSADIAVVELAGPLPNGAKPIPMNTRALDAFIGQPVRIAGYGVTANDNRDSGIKRVGTTELHKVANEPGFGQIMFIGQAVGQSKTCYGDSGGPAFMTFDGVEYLVGVTSFGTGPCEAPATEDGQVRIDSYHSWIMEFVNARDPQGLPAEVPGTGNPGTVGNGGPGGGTQSGSGELPDIVGGCSVGGGSAGSLAPLLFLGALFLVRRRRN